MAVTYKNNAITTVIYARVSTNTQDYQRQLEELREYANRMGYKVVTEFAEKVSEAKRVDEREQLPQLLAYVTDNHIDKVQIYECGWGDSNPHGSRHQILSLARLPLRHIRFFERRKSTKKVVTSFLII